jgi:TolB protein
VLGTTLVTAASATPAAPTAAAATACPARSSRVVFARSKDAFGGNWGIATVNADGTAAGWVFGPEKGGAYNFRPSISPADGTIVWDTNQGGRQRIRTMSCDGSGATNWSTRSGPKDAMAPAFSPDGTKVAFVARMPGNTSKTKPVFGLYVAPFDQPAKARLVTKRIAAGGMHPAWSPDGTKLAFGSGGGAPHIAVVDLDGTGFTQLTTTKNGDGEPSWSPDGKQIAYNSSAEGDDVWIMDADGANARKLATAAMGAYQPAFSPDGQWVAYVNNAVGHSELWMIHPDGTGAHALTTTSGKEANEAPAW